MGQFLGIASAGLGLMQSVMGMGQGMAQQGQNAQQLKTQALQQNNQANVEQRRGAIEASAIEAQKSRIRQRFEQIQSQNRAQLGAGNVDMTSGSPLKVSLGNINRFAEDMGETSYQKAARLWEAGENAKNLRWQAENNRRQASWLEESQKEMEGTMLSLLLPGAARLFYPNKNHLLTALLPVSADTELLNFKINRKK